MQKTLYEVCRVRGAEGESIGLPNQQNCDDVGESQDIGNVSSITLPQPMLATKLPSTNYVELYEKDMRSFRRSEVTIKNFRSYVKELMDVMADKPIEEADSTDIKNLVSRWESCKNSTIHTRLSSLSVFYQFLQDEDVVDKNPVRRVMKKLPKPRAHGCQRRVLDIEEVKKMIKCAMNPRDRIVLLLLYKTGVRRGGLVGINVDDVDMNRGEIFVREKKGDENGYTVFFDDETKHYLQRYLAWIKMQQSTDKALIVNNVGRRLSKGHVRDIVKKYAKKAGLISEDERENNTAKSISPHTFRRTFNTHLRDSGLREDYAKELLGQVRGETIDFYTQISPLVLREEYLRHMPQLGI